MIIGYFGLPGAGKTYKMTIDALKLKAKGYHIYSNYPVKGAFKLDFEILLQVPRFEKPALLLLDEVQRYASSRQWASLPDSLYFIFSQGRKLGLDLYYSAQDSSRVDKTLREVTNLFYDIQPFFFPFLRKVDVYSKNSDYSLQVNKISMSLFLIRKANFHLFDTFYMINKGSFEPKDFEFQIWDF